MIRKYCTALLFVAQLILPGVIRNVQAALLPGEEPDLAPILYDSNYVRQANSTVRLLIDSAKYDSAIALGSQVIASTRTLNYEAGEAGLTFLIGKAFIYKLEFNPGLQWIEKAYALYQALHDNRGIADCRLQSGVVLYYDKKDFNTALSNFTEAEKIYTSLHDSLYASKAIYLEGLCYTGLKNYTRAEEKLLWAEQIKKAIHDEDGVNECHYGLADLYTRTKQYTKSKEYYKECLDYFEKTKNTLGFTLAARVIETQNDLLSEDINNRNIILYLLIVFVILLIALMIMSVQRYRFKQRSNRQLEKANADLSVALSDLKSMQDQLIQTEKVASLGQLTAGIAHEINNPINFVSANIQPLKRNFKDLRNLLEEYEAILQQSNQMEALENLKTKYDKDFTIEESENLLKGIEEGSKRTAEIVKGLRNFSRLDEDAMKEASIQEGIESTLLLLNNKLSEKNIEVVKSFAPMPKINCYPGQLNQVFMNLISNAMDAVGKNGKIFITASEKNNQALISIRDTGTGMTDEVKQKIFDPFFTTKDVGKGTGLGLSISYRIIEKHNGKIEVNSTPGKGTEFIITIPFH